MRGPSTVVWREDTIIEVRDARNDDDIRDGVLAPGFIDTQVNGIAADSVVDTDVDVERLACALRLQGVTSWLPTIPTQEPRFYGNPLEHVIHRVMQRHAGLPEALGIHFEGPLLGRRPGAHRQDWFAVDENIIDVLLRGRMVTVAPEHPMSPDAITRLTSTGVVVALGHSAPTNEELTHALDSGASHVTHLFNAMSGVHHVEPGLALMTLLDGRLTFSVIADLEHVHEMVIRLMWKTAGDRMLLVSDQVAHHAPSGEEGARLRGARVGIDAGVRNLVRVCGVPLSDALVMASFRPASLLGLSDRGILRPGLRADLVLLSDDAEVRSVVCGGFTWNGPAN